MYFETIVSKGSLSLLNCFQGKMTGGNGLEAKQLLYLLVTSSGQVAILANWCFTWLYNAL